MAGCKRCVLKEGKREREKEEKRKGKRRKNGDQNHFIYFFRSPCACFFIWAVVIFQIYKENYKIYLDLVDYIRYCLRSKV